jgi:hypothetical protein
VTGATGPTGATGSIGATGTIGVTGPTGQMTAVFSDAAIMATSSGATSYNLRYTTASGYSPIVFTSFSGATAMSKDITINAAANTFTIQRSGYYEITADVAYFFVRGEWSDNGFKGRIWNASTSTSLRDFSICGHTADWSLNNQSINDYFPLPTQDIIVPLTAGQSIQLLYNLTSGVAGNLSHSWLGNNPENGSFPQVSNVGVSFVIQRIGDL